MDGGQIIPRKTIAQICACRDRALRLYDDAFDSLDVANQAIATARATAKEAAPTQANSYNYQSDEIRKFFLSGLKIPDREKFRDMARRLTDVDVWAHVVELTELEKLMDKKAKDELRQQLLSDPPEVTESNIYATLQQLSLDAGMIFRRGIANCFSSLDRRFRSHDGFKIGSRVILDCAFNEWGSWNYHRNQRDTLMDIERTFFVLEGLSPPPNYGGIVGAVDRGRRGSRCHQSEAESEYFKIRCYKNGNAHIWFKRDDLVEKVNKLLSEYYGEVIPDGQTPEGDGGLFTPKTSLAKNYGFYPTPEAAVDDVFRDVPLYRRENEPQITVLEPSAGTGNLAKVAVEKGAIVDCVEIQPSLADQLRTSGQFRRVLQADFLSVRPDPANLYDRVIMNPPFDRERDIDHVMHALGFLKPDGHLTAIMSAGTEFRETRKSVAFREFMAKLNARWCDLPPGSFASVGTYCNTIILRVWKNGRHY